MRAYVKPLLEYVDLSVEERFASGSGGCTIYGSCPTNCDFVETGGFSIPVNLYSA